MFIARVILGIDVGHLEGAKAVDLHDRFAVGPGVMRHAGRQMDEACRRQGFCGPVHLLAGADGEFSGDHRDELVLGMAVGRHREAVGEPEAEHKRSLLGGIAEQDCGLGAARQQRRRWTPADGITWDHRVVRIVRQGRAGDLATAERQNQQTRRSK